MSVESRSSVGVVRVLDSERSRVRILKLSTKAPNVVDKFLRNQSTHQNNEERSLNQNYNKHKYTELTWKPEVGKIMERGKFHYNNGEYCNAPSRRVRRRNCNVYTQGRNTLTIYAKHQYRQELEYGSTVVLYIPTILNKYTFIIERDPILQEYYITRRYKSMIYNVIYKV